MLPYSGMSKVRAKKLVPTGYLAMVRRHVARGARQREIIARLERAGCDTSDAERLLLQFEELQSIHIEDRERLEKKLSEISK
jgi:hypothetical protein